MGAVSRDSSSTPSSITVTWTGIDANSTNGGSAITSYNLQWDSGTSGATWTDLIGNSVPSTATTFTVSSVTAGQAYQFRVRAKNMWGWGDFSSITTVNAAGIPG